MLMALPSGWRDVARDEKALLGFQTKPVGLDGPTTPAGFGIVKVAGTFLPLPSSSLLSSSSLRIGLADPADL
jgi:hypothetical protein